MSRTSYILAEIGMHEAKIASAGDLLDLGNYLRSSLSNPVLTALFGGEQVPKSRLAAELDERFCEILKDCSLIHETAGQWYSPFSIHSVEGMLVVSDAPLPDKHERPEFYVDPLWGSGLIASVLIRGESIKSALDMGCGAGVLALVMSGYAESVIGVDINPRAVALSRLNVLLNGCTNVQIRKGDLLSAVEGEQFDRIIFNSPTSRSFDKGFRDNLEMGEEILERFASTLPKVLSAGGICQIFLRAFDYPDSRFLDRLAAWLYDNGGADIQALQYSWRHADHSGGRKCSDGHLIMQRRPIETIDYAAILRSLPAEAAAEMFRLQSPASSPRLIVEGFIPRESLD